MSLSVRIFPTQNFLFISIISDVSQVLIGHKSLKAAIFFFLPLSLLPFVSVRFLGVSPPLCPFPLSKQYSITSSFNWVITVMYVTKVSHKFLLNHLILSTSLSIFNTNTCIQPSGFLETRARPHLAFAKFGLYIHVQ